MQKTKKTFKGMEITQEKNGVIICYNQFDMGDKWKVYNNGRYVGAYQSPTMALKVFDIASKTQFD